MKRALLSASAAFACIPGLAAIIAGIGAPPHAGVWLGGLGTTVGVFTIVVFMTNSGRIKQVSLKSVNRYSVALVIVSGVMLALYMLVYDFCVLRDPAYGTAVYPLWSTGELARLVQQAGGRLEALQRFGIYAIDAAVRKSNSIVWVLTILAFVLPYVLFIACLTGGFALAAERRGRSK